MHFAVVQLQQLAIRNTDQQPPPPVLPTACINACSFHWVKMSHKLQGLLHVLFNISRDVRDVITREKPANSTRSAPTGATHLVDEALQVFEILRAVEQAVHDDHRLVPDHRNPETRTQERAQRRSDPAAPPSPC